MRAVTVLAVLIGALGAVAVTAAPLPPPGPVWPPATAITLPADAQMPAQLNVSPFLGPAVAVRSVSCTGPGNCVGVGGYEDTNGDADFLAMYVTESAGVWGTAQRLSLPASYDATASGQRAYLSSVSCPSAGNCVAVGSYTDSSGNNQAMIATETAGTWATHALTALPANAYSMQGTAGASLYSVSCTSIGNCLAVGTFKDATGGRQAMVVEEDHGAWGSASTLKLPANANTASGGQYARLTSVSCTAAPRQVGHPGPGACTAVGTYIDNSSSPNDLTLVTRETNGVWTSTQLTLPPDADATQTTGLDQVISPALSCASAGNCVAVGGYSPGAGSATVEAMYAESVSGSWGRAVAVTSPPVSDGSESEGSLDSVTCMSGGNCTAAGFYLPAGGGPLTPMVVSDVSGNWGDGVGLTPPSDSPETQSGGQGGLAQILLDYLTSVACTSPTVCVAAGGYTSLTGERPMVVSSVSPLAVATTTLPSGVVGSHYSAQLKATGGDGKYIWSLETGALPSGLALNSAAGVISGTPVAPGTPSFTVAVSDTDLAPPGQQATAALSIAILPRPSSGGGGGGGGGGTQPGSASIAKVKVEAPNATTVVLSCRGSTNALCRGTLALSTMEHLKGRKITAITATKRKATRTVTLGRTAYTLTGGATATFTIKLNGTAKHLLSGHHHFHAKLTLTATGAKTAAATKTITL